MIFHKSQHKSTIFKTITNDITGLNTGISIFNSSLTTMKRNIASGQGVMYSIFSGGKLTQNDVNAITNYANAMKGGANSAQAWSTGMNSASVAAKQYVLDARKAGKSTDEMVAGLKQIPKATSAASIGLKALSVAGNMLMMMGISIAISALFKGIDYLIHRTEKMQEALQNSVDEFNTATDELKSLEEELKTTTERLEELQRLADKGNISVAEKAELEVLKKTNKELARKVALKQEEQAQAARDVLKDSKKNATNEVASNYVNAYVLPEEELKLAIAEYNNAQNILNDPNRDKTYDWMYGDYIEAASDRIKDMYALISPTIEAYEDLTNAGIELEGKDETRYEQLKKTQNAYLEYLYVLNGTKESFEALNAEQQRNILLNRLLEKGLDENIAKSIIGSISDEDLDSYWDKDFSFVPPEMKDGETAEEYGKRYAEAWAKGLADGTQAVDETISSLEELNKQLDSIQSAYKTVQSAIEEYNEQGYLSVDTYQSLMELEPQYLNMLMDENGNLNLNTDAVNENTKAYIQNLGIKSAQKMLDTLSTYTSEAEQLDYLTGALNTNTDATWSNIYAKLYEMKLDKKITDEVYNSALTRLKAYEQMTNAASAGVGKGGVGGSSKKEDFTKTLDAELKYLDKKMEAGKVDFKDYIADRLALIEDYYAKGKISADEYYEYLEKHYETELDYMDKIASAIAHRIDREIKSVQKEIDGLKAKNEALEGTLDKYDSILSAVEQVYDTETKRLEGEKDLIQEKIDAINEEADANKKAKAIEEARYALQQAQSQRSKKLYAGSDKGFIYSTDDTAIRDAQDELQQLETERLVDELKKEQDTIDTIISSLQEYKEKWSEIPNAHKNALDAMAAQELLGADYQKLILSNRIEDIDAFKEQYISTQKKIDDNTSLIESYEEKIEIFEGLKEQWASLTETYTIEQEEFLLKQRFGADYEKVIFDERSAELQKFNDDYYSLQQEQVRIAQEAARKIIEAEKQKAKGQYGDTSTFTGIETPTTSTPYKPASTTTAYKEAQNEKFLLKNKYHSGLNKGYVGASTVSDKERLRMFQSLGSAQFKNGEIPALLKVGELVMTPEQQENIFRNVQAMHTFNYAKNVIPTTSMRQNAVPVVQHITVTLPNVTNNSGYERFQKELKQMQIDAFQMANRR